MGGRLQHSYRVDITGPQGSHSASTSAHAGPPGPSDTGGFLPHGVPDSQITFSLLGSSSVPKISKTVTLTLSVFCVFVFLIHRLPLHQHAPLIAVFALKVESRGSQCCGGMWRVTASALSAQSLRASASKIPYTLRMPASGRLRKEATSSSLDYIQRFCNKTKQNKTKHSTPPSIRHPSPQTQHSLLWETLY